MKYKMYLWIILVFTTGIVIFACQNDQSDKSTNSQTTQTIDKQTYKSIGVIKAVDIDTGRLTIDHENIPGYMTAMPMTESVSDKSLLTSIKVGDKVEFEIERTGDKVLITKLDKIGEVAIINGGEVYKTNCARCHGALGEGVKNGIPLTSGHALGHSEDEYFEQIRNGEGKKMPVFKDKLTKDEMTAVVKFVRDELQKDVTAEQRASQQHH